MKKKTALPLFVTLIIIAVFLISTANNTNGYVLYKNDTKFSLPEYPAEEINGELFVPSSFFIGFENISYSYFQREQSYYFINTKNHRYISASLNIDKIIVDGDFVEKAFPVLNSTIYVPLNYCAEILDLKTETVKDGKTTRIRVKDGTETLSFNELIKLFDPPSPPKDDPEKPPVVKPPVQEPPSPPVISKKKAVYLLILTDSSTGLEEMLDTLQAFGESATVMFDREAILSLPLQVSHALTGGNTLGIYLDEGENGSVVRETNELLKLVSNTSSCIYTAKSIDKESAAALEDNGYILWQANVNYNDYKNLNSWVAAEEMYKKALENESSCIAISAGKENLNLLKALLGHLSNDESVTLSTINPATVEINSLK